MMNIPDKKTGEADDYSANVSHSLRVDGEDAGLRLDQGLAKLLPQHSRSRLQGWIREGRVRIDGVITQAPKYRLSGDERIELSEGLDERAIASQPEDIPLDIVYQDKAIIVIDKPVGLVVHPGSGNWSGTLQNALLHHDPALGKVPRAGIVHRLDKDTSGLLVVAHTLETQTDLVRQLQAHTVSRRYYALARGVIEHGGTIDAPIGRHPTQRVKMTVTGRGKPARTHYRVVERFIDCTLLECALETGRTHQIRVHLASIGHPLVGDPIYGGGIGRVPAGPVFPRQALHAHRLGLKHPLSGEAMSWKSALPEDMEEIIAAARLSAPVVYADEDDWDEDADSPEIIYAGDSDGSEDDDLE